MISYLEDNFSWSVRHAWKESDGFLLDRKNGVPCYTFWHFFNSVDLLTPNGIVTTKPDACYICPPDTRQYIKTHGPLLHDWMHFDSDTAKVWLDCGLKFETVYYPNPISFVTDIIEKIEIEYFARNMFHQKFIDSKLTELFISFARVCNTPTLTLNNNIVELFQQIRFKMLTNLDKDWSVEALSREALISPSYFHAIYKELYGISPTKDLINNRIKSAKFALMNTNESVSDIASKLGYNSPYHFSKQFKRIVGVSPTVFRSQNSD